MTEDGVLLKPAEVVAREVAREAMEQFSKELKAQGVTLADLMAASRRARAKIATEKYGVTKLVSKPRRKRS